MAATETLNASVFQARCLDLLDQVNDGRIGRLVLTKRGRPVAPVAAEITIEASHLPGELHADPADRLLIATARHLNLPIVTGDRRSPRLCRGRACRGARLLTGIVPGR